MAVEARRGCGYRKQGGLYMVSGGSGVPCDRLPIALDVCPTCSHGFKQARGWTWIDLAGLVGGDHKDCKESVYKPCPLCDHVEQVGKAGLLWIGEKFYKTPAEFMQEGQSLGFSRRIRALPRGFKIGETYVLLAHPKTIKTMELQEASEPTLVDVLIPTFKPGIFTLWRPSAIEKILPESKRGSEEVEQLEKQGIKPVFVPDNDPDHKGSVYDKEEEEVEEVAPVAETVAGTETGTEATA